MLCEDADIALQLYEVLKNILEEKSLTELFNKVEMPFIKVLIDLEVNGLYVDTEMLKKLSLNTASKIEDILNDIYESVGKEFNVNSPKTNWQKFCLMILVLKKCVKEVLLLKF